MKIRGVELLSARFVRNSGHVHVRLTVKRWFRPLETFEVVSDAYMRDWYRTDTGRSMSYGKERRIADAVSAIVLREFAKPEKDRDYKITQVTA